MSFGVGQSMAKSVQDNLTLKGKRKTIFDRKVTTSQITQYDFDDRTATPEELIAIRRRIKKRKRNQIVIALVLTSILLVLICCVVVYVF